MLKYALAATALRLFSVNDFSRGAYRRLGNIAGGKRRQRAINPSYITRADGNLAYIEKFGAIADGMSVMELGTGWVHWEALFTRLFYDVEITLYDVWDNRQFDGFRNYARSLREQLADQVERPPAAIARAERLLDELAALTSFDAVYERLGFRYVVDQSGKLDSIAADSIDLVISSDVMEHIPADTLPRLIGDFARVLKPGGAVAQQIVEADHLRIYDRAVHGKNYLRYSDRQWRRWFDNGVQYINRLQHSDFVRLFRQGGFAVVAEEIVQSDDTSVLRIDPRWAGYDKADLDATVTRLIARPA